LLTGLLAGGDGLLTGLLTGVSSSVSGEEHDQINITEQSEPSSGAPSLAIDKVFDEGGHHIFSVKRKDSCAD